MKDLTPEQEKQIRAAAARFKRQMEKLNLGVSIRAGDGPWVEVTPPPAESGVEPSEGEQAK